eukprot:10622106-Alexandrium_andersonii.AAC.1
MTTAAEVKGGGKATKALVPKTASSKGKEAPKTQGKGTPQGQSEDREESGKACAGEGKGDAEAGVQGKGAG